jgi:hypothetical protein
LVRNGWQLATALMATSQRNENFQSPAGYKDS